MTPPWIGGVGCRRGGIGERHPVGWNRIRNKMDPSRFVAAQNPMTAGKSAISDALTSAEARIVNPQINVLASRRAGNVLPPLSDGVGLGHAAALDCEASRFGRGGKQRSVSLTFFAFATSIRGARRQSGMNSAAFQLSIVVIGKPVSRASAAEPPSASMMSGTVRITTRYDKRSMMASG